MFKKSTLYLAILLPIQIIFIKIISNFPQFVEQYYSRGLYPYISRAMRLTLGFLPFSLGDFLYAALIVSLIFWIIRRFKQRFRKPKLWLLDAVASLSIIYFCFNLFWGFNYYRLPLHQSLEIENDYTTEQLISLTERLIAESNKLHDQLAENDSVKVEFQFSKNELFRSTINGYSSLKNNFPELEYKSEALKRSLYSIPLSYMGFNGYLNPLTNEAQVNTVIIPYKIPTTASHEIGHQLGFAKENEANFIACLATLNHPDPYFRYSGFTFALNYCLSELYVRDLEKFEEIKKTLNPGILENYREVHEFWVEHQNPFEPLFQLTYNQYLKANNQADGLKSYSYVVALLVNYYGEGRNNF